MHSPPHRSNVVRSAARAWAHGNAVLCALALAGCPQQVPDADAFGTVVFADTAQGDDSVTTNDSVGQDVSGDTNSADTSVTDTGVTDTGVTDTGVTDTGVTDSDGGTTNLNDVTVTDTATKDTLSKDTNNNDTSGEDAIGKPCTTAADCGTAPSQCTSWQCTGLCYPLLANSGACDDGDPCTTGDVCFVGTCQAGKALNCDDGNACTTDSCAKPSGCSHVGLAEGSDCGGGKTCQAGQCGGGVGGGVLGISAKAFATCALTKGAAGKAFCWGDDTSYQAGSAKSQGKWFYLPEPVSLKHVVKQIAVGGEHACALTSAGVYCWGDDQFGQSSGKGDGQTPNALVKVPTLVAVPAVQLALGQFHSCALDTGGTVRCWGLGNNGQLGDGQNNVATPPVVVLLPGSAKQIACGNSHCCAIVGSTPHCWGYNGSGQIGIGTNAEAPSPVAAKGVTGALVMAAGNEHTCALLTGGQVKCWGANGSHQTGVTGSSTNLTPGYVPNFGGASAIAAGGAHTCVVKGGKVLCWGSNSKLQAVPASKGLILSAPTEVDGLSDIDQLALGDSHSCARTSAGAVWCWGGNNMGQIGDGTNKDVKAPWWVQ